MADPEQLARFKRDVRLWNAWRNDHPSTEIDLSKTDLSMGIFCEANLSRADLSSTDFSSANLGGANLRDAIFFRTNLTDTDLTEADLSNSNLARANLMGANLTGAHLTPAILHSADLSRAILMSADLSNAELDGAVLTGANFYETVLGNTVLASARGLESCKHTGPSTIDHRTLAKSGSLPLAFLRGVGLPERLIEYLPSLLGEAIQFYKCFISYSHRDEAFAQRLHTDLQNKGVRCWYAPHDLPIGAKTRPAIDEAIREYDKLLLILSKYSVASPWVEHEIDRALAKELHTRKVVLFPVRLDDTIMSAAPTWAQEIREDRNIGDMRRWKNNHDAYQRTFERVLRDLRAENATPAPRTEA